MKKNIILLLALITNFVFADSNINRSIDSVLKTEVISFDLRKQKSKLNTSNSRTETNSIIENPIIPVKLNNLNSSFSENTEGGFRIWRLTIAINEVSKFETLFDTLQIDSTDILFVKDKNRKVWDKFFNHKNGIEFTSNIHSDTVIFELYRTANSKSKISISHFIPTLAYNPPDFSKPGECGPAPKYDMPNIHCHKDATNANSIGFENQKRSAVMIYVYKINENAVNICYGGTGTLMNNSSKDFRPIIYTVGHNLANDITGSLSNFSREFSQYVRFYFNYNDINQKNGNYFDDRKNYILGCKVLLFGGCQNGAFGGYEACTFYDETDQALIEMKERPDLWMNTYYAGWTLTGDGEDNFTSFHHPSLFPKKVSKSSGIYVYDGDFSRGSSGAGMFTNNTKRISKSFNSVSNRGSNRPGCDATHIDSHSLKNLDKYGKAPFEFQNPPTGVRPILDPAFEGLDYMDGLNHCPKNVKYITGNTWMYQVEKSYIKQIAGKFIISDCVLSTALIDFQATEKIQLTSGGNGKSFRVKPIFNTSTPNTPYNYPYYFRARAISCGAYSNPPALRKEMIDSEHSYSKRRRLYQNIIPNPSQGTFKIFVPIETKQLKVKISKITGENIC
ncbi:MAG: hypothetical protein EAZ27_08325 [Cytophagales bacterium]|nr:MAG: hypothetical protein EAZ27_08325 [Cytophagales bacterium]